MSTLREDEEQYIKKELRVNVGATSFNTLWIHEILELRWVGEN